MVDIFPPDFFEVGNVGVLSLADDLMESQVYDMIDYIRRNYGYAIPAHIITSALEEYDIDYPTLPKYLKDAIDSAFDVC